MTLDEWKKVIWFDESRFTLFQSDGCIRVRREADEVMHPSSLVPTVKGRGEQCYDLGWLQLVRSRFSNVMCQKTLNIMSRFSINQSINQSSSLMHGDIFPEEGATILRA